MQRMSENFIDAFGFQDAAFNDDGEDDNTEMNTLTNALSDSEAGTNPSEASKRSQGIFESICEQRFTSFPGGFDGDEENNEMNQEEDEDEEDPWADKTKEINFSTKSPDKAVAESTSSDEEENNDMAKKPKKMEVDEEDDDAGKKNKSYLVTDRMYPKP